jgi:vacuolar-type H+-ATPase subunit H
MGVSRIEQLIEDIYGFVESCKMQPLSSTKVIVPKDELYDLLDELRLRTPDEIKRYQKIIANRDAIMADAEDKASVMLAEAQEKTNSLISEHEIMQQAYYQANEIVNQATDEANRILAQANYDYTQIRSGALSYTEELLSDVEKILASAYEDNKNRYDALLGSLKGSLDIVISNKKELSQQSEENDFETDELSGASLEDESDSDEKEDFDFDVNTFLEDID